MRLKLEIRQGTVWWPWDWAVLQFESFCSGQTQESPRGCCALAQSSVCSGWLQRVHSTPKLLIVTLLGVTAGKFIGNFPALQELLPHSSYDFSLHDYSLCSLPYLPINIWKIEKSFALIYGNNTHSLGLGVPALKGSQAPCTRWNQELRVGTN